MHEEFAKHLNEPQVESIDRLRQALRGSHYVNLVVRKGAQDIHFECDWLRHALDILCGGPLPSLIGADENRGESVLGEQARRK